MDVYSKSPTLNSTRSRNESMDLCKLIASVFVVFDHAIFPGKLGEILICLCSFAVPIFFMISGYCNYGASTAQIHRRTRNIFKLLLIGTFFQIIGNCFAIELNHGSTIAYLRAAIPDPDEIVKWIVLHLHPYAGHLWFLNGLIAVYLVFGLFVRLQSTESPNYHAFYCLTGILFVFLFAFGTILPESGQSDGLPVRNGWFVGIPMFGAGLFLRENEDRIASVFSCPRWVLYCFIAGGMCFSVLEQATVGIGLIPFGMYFTIFSLMFLLVSNPIISGGSRVFAGFLRCCGPISMWIYLFHLFFVTKYEQFLQLPLRRLAGEAEPYLYPLCILALSVINAIVWEMGSSLLKQRR